MTLRSVIFVVSCTALLFAAALFTPRVCEADPSASSVEGHHVGYCDEGAPCLDYSVPSGKTPECYRGICLAGGCTARAKEDGTHLETRAVNECRQEALICRDGVGQVADQTSINDRGRCSAAADDFNVCTNPGCNNGTCIPDHPALRPQDDSLECGAPVVSDCRQIPYRCVSGACVARNPVVSGNGTSCDDIQDDKVTCVVGQKCDGICTVRGCDGNGSCVQDAPFFWYQTNGEVCGPPSETECKVSALLCQDGQCTQSDSHKEGPCQTLSNGQQVKTGRCFKPPACSRGLCEQEVIEPCCGNGEVEAPGEDCDPGRDTPECQRCRTVQTGTSPLCRNGVVDPGEQCDPKAPSNSLPESCDASKRFSCTPDCKWQADPEICPHGCPNKPSCWYHGRERNADGVSGYDLFAFQNSWDDPCCCPRRGESPPSPIVERCENTGEGDVQGSHPSFESSASIPERLLSQGAGLYPAGAAVGEYKQKYVSFDITSACPYKGGFTCDSWEPSGGALVCAEEKATFVCGCVK